MRKVVGLGLMACFILRPLECFPAKARGSELRVFVFVPPKSQLSTLFQTPSIVLNEADLARGHIDIAAATRISFQSNNKSGFVLLFKGLAWPFKRVIVYGLSHEVEIDMPAAFIHQPYSKGAVTTTLSYRFLLAEDARAGEYPWPLSLTPQSEF